VTHGHFDHLLDVPAVMAKTRARLVASASSVDLAKRAGASSGDAVKPGDVRRIGPWKIRVLSATHDRLFGKVPFDRPPSQAGLSAEAAYSAEAAAKAGSAKAEAAATRRRLDLRGTACVFDRGERPAHLHRLRRNTDAVAA
jgi:Predicted hydrolase of the metallo-beta-lactamase superfamily